MSNIIPPLVSNSPPPPPSPDEDDDDEFGDLSAANDYSYGCDNLSLPSTPEDSPKKVASSKGVDINCNADHKKTDDDVNIDVQKDYLDKRKNSNSLNNDKLGYCNHNIDKNTEIGNSNEIKQNSDVDINQIVNRNNFEHSSSSCEDEEIVNNSYICDSSSFKCEKIDDLPLDELSFDSCEKDNEFIKEISDFSDVYKVIEQSGLSYSDKNNESDEEFGDFIVNASTDRNEVLYNSEFDKIKNPSFHSDSVFMQKNGEVNHEEDKIINRGDRSVVVNDIETNLEENNHIDYNTRSGFDVDSDFHGGIIKSTLIFEQNGHLSNLHSQRVNKTKEPSFGESCQGEASGTGLDENFSARKEENVEDQDHEDEDGFGDFVTPDLSKYNESDDDFGDFANFSLHQADLTPTETLSNMPGTTTNVSDDEFGDFTSSNIESFQSVPKLDFEGFANFTELHKPNKRLHLNEKEASNKAKEILKEIIPPCEQIFEDVDVVELGSDDLIFNQLKDITDTPALGYQWSKSASQKMLLKALNIDARNILYGPTWNSQMPRFAANLTLDPLEPVKTECTSPSVLKSSPVFNQQPPTEIPNAQFDWSGSGLTNPLDPISKKPEDHALEPRTQPQISSINFTPEKCPSSHTEMTSSDSHADSFESFNAYKSPEIPQTWSKTVPLRETYISSGDTQEHIPEVPLNVAAWLQPTIVTPEFPRKQLDTDDDVVEKADSAIMDMEGSELVSDVRSEVEAVPSVLSKAELSIFDSLSKTDNLIPSSNENSPERIVHKGTEEPQEGPSNEEDEFTDFQFSVPSSIAPVHTVPLTPILEPLKPEPVSSTTSYNAPTQINWPDPGVTDEELKKFDEVFSQPEVAVKAEPPKLARQDLKQKQSSFDDEEWTDFMSVQKPSPVHKLKLFSREQTSSPDLTLSVFNLGSIQPTRQPVPVITPTGLIQTKLSSNVNSVSMSPKAAPKNNVMIPQSVFQAPPPSIISNQYATQAYSFSNNMCSNNQHSTEDDEWGEFVSAQTVANGWASDGQTQSKKVPNVNKSSVSSMVLPDLDFVAPRGRIFNSRNK